MRNSGITDCQYQGNVKHVGTDFSQCFGAEERATSKGTCLTTALHCTVLCHALQVELMGRPVVQLDPTPSCSRFLEDMVRNGEVSYLKGLWPLCANYMVCGNTVEQGGVRVHFALSQYLGGVNESTKGPREQAWGEDLVEFEASVVVLNRGAHFVRNTRFSAELEATTKLVREKVPNALIIFRATAAGHPNCAEHTAPLDEPMSLEGAPDNWQIFEKQNKLARHAVELVGGMFVDVQPMTALRPDWHVLGHNKDCRHHCQPGPVDDWVKVFALVLHEAVV